MIWGYAFAEIETHLARLGFRRVREVAGTILFSRGDEAFTLRAPNVDGLLPETIVIDAFDRAGLPPPTPATRYVD